MSARLGQFTVCGCITIERPRGAVSSVLNQYFIYNDSVKIILDVLIGFPCLEKTTRVVILQTTVANNHNILFIYTSTTICDNKLSLIRLFTKQWGIEERKRRQGNSETVVLKDRNL